MNIIMCVLLYRLNLKRKKADEEFANETEYYFKDGIFLQVSTVCYNMHVLFVFLRSSLCEAILLHVHLPRHAPKAGGCGLMCTTCSVRSSRQTVQNIM